MIRKARGALRRLKGRVRPHVITVLDSLRVPHALSRDIFDGLRRLSRPPAAPPTGPPVLVVSFRGGWLLHGTWEALIAEALRRRGAAPTVFVCSGGLPETLPGRAPACSIAGMGVREPLPCEDCLRAALDLGSAVGLPVLRLDDLVPRGAAAELMGRVDRMSRDELRSLVHNGLPLGQYVLNSARWFLCVSDVDSVEEGEGVLRAFAKSALVVAEAAPLLLDRIRPLAVLLLNGLFFAERIVKAEAERRGIRVVSYERGFMPDTLVFSHGVPGYYDIDGLWGLVGEKPLSSAEGERLDDYVADRRKGRRAPFNYWPTLTEDSREVLGRLDLDPRRPIAVLFTNITWDTAAQDRDRAFADMFSWVVETVRLFEATPLAQLVIRAHPAEVRVPGWETRDPVLARLARTVPALPPNVRLVGPESDLSSYTLMELARCGLVYTSTAGLEMAMEGIPTVVAGLVHYGGKGFTLDPGTIEDYGDAVTRALALPRDATVRERARRYGYAFFFRSFLPMPLVAENAPDFVPTLKTKDPHVLDPGGDPSLDIICKGVLEGAGFESGE